MWTCLSPIHKVYVLLFDPEYLPSERLRHKKVLTEEKEQSLLSISFFYLAPAVNLEVS